MRNSRTKPTKRKTTAENLEAKFDAGERVSDYFDMEAGQASSSKIQAVNVNFPAAVVKALDKEAERIGVNRQALIKFWINEKLDRVKRDAG